MLRTCAVVGGFLLLFASVSSADEVTKRTAVTLNEPLIVAGVQTVTLEPGKYVIKLMRSDTDRNIVLFYNEREDKLFATALAINNYRLFPTDKTVLRFWETPQGNPMALKAWFAPGDRWGQEFVYPKGLAARIAHDTGASVLTSPATTEAELRTAPVTEIEPTGKEAPLEEAYVAPPVSAWESLDAELAEVSPEPEPEPEPEPLPATASPLFAIGLAGLFFAATGLAVRRMT